MSVIADFRIPAEAFALDHLFQEIPDAVVEVERLATHSREWVMPFLWATDADLEAFESVLRSDPSVDEVTTVDVASDVGLYNVHWSDEVASIVDTIVDQHGIVLEANAIDGHWNLKLRFLDQRSLESFHTYFEDHDYAFEIDRLTIEDEPKRREFDLTPAQREALVTALETGYFAVPRETTASELADHLGISTNATSQRLRRASENLVRNTLTPTPYDTRSSG